MLTIVLGGSTALSAVGSSSRDMSFAESREFLENIDEIRHNMNVAWRTQQATYRGDRSIESSNARIEQEIRNARTDIAQARTAEEARDKELLTEIKALRNDIMELKLVLQQQQPLQQRQQQEITSDSAWSGPRNPGSNPLGPGEYTAFNIASADCGQSRGAFRAQGRGQRSRGSRGQCPDHGYFGGGRGTHIHRGRPPPPTTRPARAPPAPVSM